MEKLILRDAINYLKYISNLSIFTLVKTVCNISLSKMCGRDKPEKKNHVVMEFGSKGVIIIRFHQKQWKLQRPEEWALKRYMWKRKNIW